MRQLLLLLLTTLSLLPDEIVDVEQKTRIGRRLHASLPPRGHEDGSNLRKGAAHQLLETVPFRPRQEHDEADEDRAGADAVSPLPADVVLDVDEDGDGGEGAEADEEEEPVKEFDHLLLLLRVGLVELVGAEAGDAGFQAAGAEGGKVESGVKNHQLLGARRNAGGAAGGAFRRLETGNYC